MFLVVETINDKGEKEWKAAPKRWVYMKKNSGQIVLFWPDALVAKRQKQLARDGSSKPMAYWSRKECVVKRNCPSYDSAIALVKTLYSKRLSSNTSLSLHSHPIRRQDRHSVEQIETVEGNGNVEDSDAKLSPAPATQSNQEDEATILATLTNIQSMLESLITRHNRIEEQNARIQKQNAEIKEQTVHIEQQKAELMKKLFSMQKRFANLNSQQFDVVDNTIEKAFFEFNPVETVEQLIDLENKLKDASFRSEMVSWLSFSVTGMDPSKRMGRCLDLLFSAEFLAKCLWSGLNNRGGVEISLNNRRNILELFKTIGTTPWAIVNNQDLALFFRRKLKYARERSSALGKRTQGNQLVDKQGDSAHLFVNRTNNNADSSNADPQGYTGSMED